MAMKRRPKCPELETPPRFPRQGTDNGSDSHEYQLRARTPTNTGAKTPTSTSKKTSPRFEPYVKQSATQPSPRTPGGRSLTFLLEDVLSVEDMKRAKAAQAASASKAAASNGAASSIRAGASPQKTDSAIKITAGDRFAKPGSKPHVRRAASAPVKRAEPLPPQVVNTPIYLLNSWTFYFNSFTPGLSAKEYDKSIRELHSFDTVQGFWALFNALPPMDSLKPKSSYHLMKTGVRPVWEDPRNMKGGVWSFRLEKVETNTVWKEMLLALIGEQFDSVLSKGDEICGMSISIRHPKNVMEIWTADQALKNPDLVARVQTLVGGSKARDVFYKPHVAHDKFDGGRTDMVL